MKSATDPIIGPKVGVTNVRFYIILLFSVFTMEQCANWNNFGPIAASAKVIINSWKKMYYGLYGN